LLEVAARDRGAAGLESAKSLAVARQLAAGIVGDAHLHAERRVALLAFDVEELLAAQAGIFRLERAERAERAHLGHAPGVADLHAVDLLERLGHGARTGGA